MEFLHIDSEVERWSTKSVEICSLKSNGYDHFTYRRTCLRDCVSASISSSSGGGPEDTDGCDDQGGSGGGDDDDDPMSGFSFCGK